MAKNNRDRLIQTFLSRNQNRRVKPPGTPNISNTTSSYRPAKQGGSNPGLTVARDLAASQAAAAAAAQRAAARRRKRSY